MDNKVIDFTGSNIYAGLDVHKKNWYVTILTDEMEHTRHLVNLRNHRCSQNICISTFPVLITIVPMKQDLVVMFIIENC